MHDLTFGCNYLNKKAQRRHRCIDKMENKTDANSTTLLLSWFGTHTAIKSGGVKLALLWIISHTTTSWTQYLLHF